MVASLLSYLVDVRSAFLGGGPQLKWIGFCFAAATVLIERYAHTQGDRELQGCYTVALGARHGPRDADRALGDPPWGSARRSPTC